jgi:hypothetical protein
MLYCDYDLVSKGKNTKLTYISLFSGDEKVWYVKKKLENEDVFRILNALLYAKK